MTPDVKTVIERQDELLSRERVDEAGRLLYGALETYLAEGDELSALSIYNEIMGFERQYGTNEKAVETAKTVLRLLEERDMTVSRPAAYLYLNCATVFKNAGDETTAKALYEKAEPNFRRFYPADAPDFAGLYNNRAACFWHEGDWRTAAYYYARAAEILTRCGEHCDLAVTYYNLAELYARFDPLSGESERYVERAKRAFDVPEKDRDAYYYYTCRKLSASAAALGYFADEEDYKRRADAYYGRA